MPGAADAEMIKQCGQAGQSVTTGRRAAWPNSTQALLTHRPWDASSGSSDEQLAALPAGASRTCAVPVRRVTPRDSRSSMTQPALLLTCATAVTRPTSAPNGPGGGRRRQQAPVPGPTVRQLAQGASQQPDGQVNGERDGFNDMIEKIGIIIDAAGVMVIVTGVAIAFVVTAVRLSRRESAVYLRFRQQLGQAIARPRTARGRQHRPYRRRLAQSDQRGDTGSDRPHPHLPELLARGRDNRAVAVAQA